MPRHKFYEPIAQFVTSEDATSSVECAVILGLIIVVAVVGIGLFGGETANSIDNSQQLIEQALQGGS